MIRLFKANPHRDYKWEGMVEAVPTDGGYDCIQYPKWPSRANPYSPFFNGEKDIARILQDGSWEEVPNWPPELELDEGI